MARWEASLGCTSTFFYFILIIYAYIPAGIWQYFVSGFPSPPRGRRRAGSSYSSPVLVSCGAPAPPGRATPYMGRSKRGSVVICHSFCLVTAPARTSPLFPTLEAIASFTKIRYCTEQYTLYRHIKQQVMSPVGRSKKLS